LAIAVSMSLGSRPTGGTDGDGESGGADDDGVGAVASGGSLGEAPGVQPMAIEVITTVARTRRADRVRSRAIVVGSLRIVGEG
jgi:hypothetical protein